MTGHDGTDGHGPAEIELSGHDLDLLADYLGGALDGTPAHAEVARRIAEDSVWGRAHEVLSPATAAVTADLAAWGRTAEPMPSDIAERLAGALATAASGEGATPTRERPEPDTGPERRGGLSVVRGERAGPRRRVPRWAAPLAVAAAAVAIVGLGVRALPEMSGDDSVGGQAADAPVSSPEIFSREEGASESDSAPALARLPIRHLAASGTAYRGDTLTTAAKQVIARHGTVFGEQPDLQPPQPGGSFAARVTPTLRRLLDPQALQACLTAIGNTHSRSAAAVDVVDYATFEGEPALIVIFADTAGERWAWVAGPGCGLPGTGADTRAAAAVG